jgi:raffinose/stachyose/melibiose transport system substrate-binding protein
VLLLTVLAMVAAACGGGGGETTDTTGATGTTAGGDEATTTTADSGTDTTEGGSAEPVTIEWWHLQNNDPGLSDWQAMADAFMDENPNVTIEITVRENEALKAALQTALQAGDVPDLFQSWGGGGLRDQVEAGLVQDITDTASCASDLSPAALGLYQVDGRQYALPYNIGVVGIWYNADLFEQAGLEGPSDTWEGLLQDVQTLKDAGITPIAVGAGDKWPAHFWYSYLMVRLGGADGMNQMAEDLNFSVPHVVEAGEKVQELVALEPFQPGFLAAKWDAPDGESGAIASQQAAMDLMGQWAPGAFRTQAGVDTTAGEELPWTLGWAPFPAVEGGAGSGTDAFGGGDGFAIGKDAPPEAVEFLCFITNADNQRTWATNSGLPVNMEAVDAVTDPNMQAVLEGVNSATFMQLYLDQFFTADLGAVINDQTQLLFAGEITPEEAAEAITAAAGGG